MAKETPLSGGNGKVTRADVIHDELFIECKLRAKHTAVSLWDDTAKLAKDEGKTPVIALCEKNRPGFWIMVHSDDLKNKGKKLMQPVNSINNIVSENVDFSMLALFMSADVVVKSVIIILISSIYIFMDCNCFKTFKIKTTKTDGKRV